MKSNKSKSTLIKNDTLKIISQNMYFIQIMIEIILFPLFATIFYLLNINIVEKLDLIRNTSFAIFGINQAFFCFFVPYLLDDKKSYLESQHQIYEFKTLKKIKKSHLEDLKRIDCRILLNSQILNFLFWSILILSSTFGITIYCLIFSENQKIIAALNCGQIITGIFFMISSCLLLGFRLCSPNLKQMYHDMITKETELVNS